MASDEQPAPLALPAAASVETQWFAVDELGHVAAFSAGELRAVPETIARCWPIDSSIADLAPMLGDIDPEALSYEAADIFAEPQRGWFARLGSWMLEAPPRFEQSLFGVLVQLRPLAGARERFAGLGLHVLPTREGSGYAWGHVESPLLRELWREGWIARAWLGHELAPTRMGMFLFEHDDDRWAEADDVYRLWDTPPVPLRVHALPTLLRARLGAVRFPGVDFRKTERLRASGAVVAVQSG